MFDEIDHGVSHLGMLPIASPRRYSREVMLKLFQSPTANRVIFAVICVMIVLTGAGHLLHGRIVYQGSRGFWVFAPFAILIGALGFVLAIWRPTLFAPTQKKEDRRSSNRPTAPKHSHRKRR